MLEVVSSRTLNTFHPISGFVSSVVNTVFYVESTGNASLLICRRLLFVFTDGASVSISDPRLKLTVFNEITFASIILQTISFFTDEAHQGVSLHGR